jgi:hypothetical protein
MQNKGIRIHSNLEYIFCSNAFFALLHSSQLCMSIYSRYDAIIAKLIYSKDTIHIRVTLLSHGNYFFGQKYGSEENKVYTAHGMYL